MSLRQGIALRLAGLAAWLMPAPQRHWGTAMQAEIATIANPDAALAFALGALRAACGAALMFHLFDPLRLPWRGAPTGENGMLPKMSPLHTGLIAACGAVGLGLFYMAMAGAPNSYLVRNALALAIGLTAFGLFAALGRVMRVSGGLVCLLLAFALLVLGQLGEPQHGAVRWVQLGGLGIQPSLILLPVMIGSYARSRSNGLAAGAVALAALALALQPDRAMAGSLAAAAILIAMSRSDWRDGLAASAALLGFAVTLLRPDHQPAMPWVDQIAHSAFYVGWLPWGAIWLGFALLLLPAMPGWWGKGRTSEIRAAFGACWGAIILAALLGNYPTPLVGYSGSAIVGYVLSLLALRPGALVPESMANRPAPAKPATETADNRALVAA